MEIVSYGKKNKIYRVTCPHCGTVIQAAEYEFHFFEGMYDEPLVEPNKPCPICHRYFSMLRQDFKKCVVHNNDSPKKKGLFSWLIKIFNP